VIIWMMKTVENKKKVADLTIDGDKISVKFIDDSFKELLEDAGVDLKKSAAISKIRTMFTRSSRFVIEE